MNSAILVKQYIDIGSAKYLTPKDVQLRMTQWVQKERIKVDQAIAAITATLESDALVPDLPQIDTSALIAVDDTYITIGDFISAYQSTEDVVSVTGLNGKVYALEDVASQLGELRSKLMGCEIALNTVGDNITAEIEGKTFDALGRYHDLVELAGLQSSEAVRELSSSIQAKFSDVRTSATERLRAITDMFTPKAGEQDIVDDTVTYASGSAWRSLLTVAGSTTAAVKQILSNVMSKIRSKLIAIQEKLLGYGQILAAVDSQHDAWYDLQFGDNMFEHYRSLTVKDKYQTHLNYEVATRCNWNELKKFFGTSTLTVVLPFGYLEYYVDKDGNAKIVERLKPQIYSSGSTADTDFNARQIYIGHDGSDHPVVSRTQYVNNNAELFYGYLPQNPTDIREYIEQLAVENEERRPNSDLEMSQALLRARFYNWTYMLACTVSADMVLSFDDYGLGIATMATPFLNPDYLINPARFAAGADFDFRKLSGASGHNVTAMDLYRVLTNLHDDPDMNTINDTNHDPAVYIPSGASQYLYEDACDAIGLYVGVCIDKNDEAAMLPALYGTRSFGARYKLYTTTQLAAIAAASGASIVYAGALITLGICTVVSLRALKYQRIKQGALERSLTSEIVSGKGAVSQTALKQAGRMQLRTTILAALTASLGRIVTSVAQLPTALPSALASGINKAITSMQNGNASSSDPSQNVTLADVNSNVTSSKTAIIDLLDRISSRLTNIETDVGNINLTDVITGLNDVKMLIAGV